VEGPGLGGRGRSSTSYGRWKKDDPVRAIPKKTSEQGMRRMSLLEKEMKKKIAAEETHKKTIKWLRRKQRPGSFD